MTRRWQRALPRLDPPAVRVLVCDDAAELRALVRAACEAAGHSVIGEAADGPAAARQAGTLAPDVIVLDLLMGGRPDEVVARVAAQAPRAAIVAYSGLPPSALGPAARAALAAHVSKTAPMDVLVGEIAAAAARSPARQAY
jgi:DNA-binding NarL/FixJ family response regulator